MGEVTYTATYLLARGRERALVFIGAAAVIGGLGAARGGYFASSWGWAILGAVAAVCWILSRGETLRPTLVGLTFLVSLTALAVWFAFSSMWGRPAQALDETGRALVYVVIAAVAIGVARRTTAVALVGGVLAGASMLAAYALATRLFPYRIGTFDSVATYRLATPIGYWNALGLLCGVALLAAAALLVSTDSASMAAFAAAPAPGLGSALYYTFSRGSWLALGIGLAVALALTPHRVRLTGATLVIAAPTAVSVWLSSRSASLTRQHATVARAAHDGHRLALVILVLVLVSALLGAASSVVRTRFTPRQTVERGYAVLLLCALVAAFVGVAAHYGGPSSAARRAWESFSAPPPKAQADLRKRLFNFSSNGRVDLWSAAIRDFEAHKLTGSGAGSYETYWLEHRTTPLKVRDAHSLYLETLAELGIVGLLLLVVALGAPLVAAVRARRRPFVGAAAGSYVAFLVHAGVDWDWEITSVTLAGLLIGVALLASARDELDEQRILGRRAQIGALAAAVIVGAFGFVFLVGNMFLSRASAAAGSGHWATAAQDAKRASSWLPWSTDPQRQLGEAQLALGNTKAAQASFHKAIRTDSSDWNLWLDLARASSGPPQRAALAHATKLNPLSPEIRELKGELGQSGGIDIGAGG